MNRLGAYGLTHLIVGSPTTWTIVAPRDHEVLAKHVHKVSFLPRSPSRLKPALPPQCLESASHQNLYFTQAACNQKLRLNTTQVIQEAGELMVIFPFAHYQFYNHGFNIVESMPYASERWEVLAQNKFINQCSAKCSGGEQGTIDLSLFDW